ncbi:DUF3791 domain-containing protein [Bacteroides sp. UBA939]|uniref:DUF3791 domain-containing protein n=1 Tax=Bacteroides sp. UBA939 TaxID=1946092 RepID=UPI0025C3D8A6|nr:DUF3791 domain-containing protein [Bacteroides sp. UBA939]
MSETISKLEQNKLYFISFCIEQYKKHSGTTGGATMGLFDRYGVTNYLFDHYDVLHTQGNQWLIEEIESFIKERGGLK